MRKLFVQLKEGSDLRYAATVGTVFSLAAGLVCYIASDRWIERDAHQRFVGYALSARTNLEHRIESYSDLLRRLGSFMRVNPRATPDTFRTYVEGLHLTTRFPGVRFVNYAEHVLERDRPLFIQRLSATYGPILPAGQAAIWPPGRRPEYHIVTLVHPEWNHGSLGGDVGAIPSRATLLGVLRESGEMNLSGEPIVGKNWTVSEPIFGVRSPLYRTGMPTSSPQQRRAAFFGTVGIAFSAKALVQAVLADLLVRNVRMTVVDVTPGPQSRLLPLAPGGRLVFDSGSGATPALRADAEQTFSAMEAMRLYNRSWNVTFSVPKRAFYTGSETYFPMLAAGAGAITAFLLYALFHAMSSSRRRALALAHDMTVDLRRLAARAAQVKESERQRIAREIHDELGQNLLALRIEADMLTERSRMRHPRLHARAALTRDHIDTTIRSVRQIINDLRPAVLDLGLAAALEWQVAEFTRRSGIECHLAGHAGIELDDHRATAFFRILQESLSNVMRHAHATVVHVEVQAAPGVLHMTIADNGIGMPAGAGNRHGSFGLLGMEERVTMLAGTFSLRSAPGQGTRISVSIPMPPASAPPLVTGREGPAIASTSPQSEADAAVAGP